MSTDPRAVMQVAPVVPVVTFSDVAHAIPVARALAAGGIGTIEITLRSSAGLAAIEAIAASEEVDIVVGAGTVRTPSDVKAAVAAGAQFLVTPGTTAAMLDALAGAPVPALPGAATLSEVLELTAQGVTAVKWFPAHALGGPATLKAIRPVVPEVEMCPTGGITPETAPDYLSIPGLPCVGGSWLTPADAIAAQDWDRITNLASAAATLG